MSHTDKTDPWRVRATHWEPSHWRCENATWPYYASLVVQYECDIPDEPNAKRDRKRRSWNKGETRCHWDPVYPPLGSHRWLTFAPVPKWFVDHRWNNVERTRERTQLAEIRKALRADRGTEVDFPCWQTRHGARWDWD